ncbi:MAG: glycoside hydrolase family 57 [Candidatus Limiplasma sp.]|nr:glycoside hydrolase family 57 [Candidatus Limiplasma sp.]
MSAVQPKIIFMPHANIQYSQLMPEKRGWVIRHCYGELLSLVEREGYTLAFEASGKTIDVIAEEAPDVMAQLRSLVQAGRVEPVASPYIHFMLSNVPPELCLESLQKSLDAWQRHTGVRPVIGWNPECGWASYIPEVYRQAGIEALVMDADSFFLSFEEIRKATALFYDVEGHSNKTQLFKIEEYIQDKPEYLRYLTNPSVAPNGLKLIFRSDCMANLLLWYLMGATEGLRGSNVDAGEIRRMLAVWKTRVADTGSFIMPYAEDAEYIGSTAYFYVKQFNEARFFEPEPASVQRFQQIVDMAVESGYQLATPSQVLAAEKPIENRYVDQIENGVAWHGGTAKAWTNTPFARIMDPVCRSIFEGIQTVRAAAGPHATPALHEAMAALASAWVSDSRWPPEPTSPGRFNVQESVADLYAANDALSLAMEQGGVAARKALYSPGLMRTQIRAIERTLMAMRYFGE